MSMPLFRATPILVLCAPKSIPTTLMFAVWPGYRQSGDDRNRLEEKKGNSKLG